MHKAVINTAIFVAGLAALIYGVVFFKIASIPYHQIEMAGQPESTKVFTVLTVRFPTDPTVPLVTSKWRKARQLPPRQPIWFHYQDWDHRSFPPTQEKDLWPWPPYSQESSEVLEQRMLEHRSGEVLTVPGAFSLFWVAAVSAVMLSPSFFLLISGVIRALAIVPRVRPPTLRAHLLLSTVFAGCTVCFFSRFAFVSWTLTYPPDLRVLLGSFHWSAWRLVQGLQDLAAMLGASALFASLASSLALFSIASALRFVSHRCGAVVPLVAPAYRISVYHLAGIVICYFVLSLLVQQPITPHHLLVQAVSFF